MKTAIVEHATTLGFDACHVTTADQPQSSHHFRNWIAEGRHGEMAYLERSAEKRCDPGIVLEGARSILLLAASYHHATLPTRRGNGGRGTVARYACRTDYHEVLAPRLAALCDFLQQLGGEETRSRWYVDTGPVLERDLAQRAGLGFIGKHTNLIRRDLGNWVVLAAILSTIALEPDAPEKNRCGTCSRCLSACPTAAITGPFRLDARRCISYLTIELKGPIPLELRPAIGRRIFGCDDCLAVCPWNRFAREGRLLREVYREDLEEPDLLELLKLDGPTFKRRFAGTPILRAKRRGLLRNVCVALGNTGGSKCVPALTLAASDPDPLIAEHAAWAVQRVIDRGEDAAPPAGVSPC